MLADRHRALFGQVAADNTTALMREWRETALDPNSPVYRAAEGILRAYRNAITAMPGKPAMQNRLLGAIDSLLREEDQSDFVTPITPPPIPEAAYESLLDLSRSRRSTRDFSGKAIDFALVERAVGIAQLSPSACNRQPWHLHFYEDPTALPRIIMSIDNY